VIAGKSARREIAQLRCYGPRSEEKKDPKMDIRQGSSIFARTFAAVLAAAFLASQGSPAGAAKLTLHTNQDMIEELLAPNDLDVSNPNSVFEAVFDALASKVTVYPTESYYYFTFPYKGIIYAGNIRFDAWDQFDGKVHFAYFPEYAYWRKPTDPLYKKLGPDDGVEVKKIDKFHYTIAFKGKTVEFELPDLSKIKPAPGQVRDDETYIGPIWDESGVQFFLVFNKTAKTFLYLLNDNPKMDQYQPSSISPALTIGMRTSFAFIKDKFADRQILMGDFFGNTQLNNYYDGPFDQLPDNFVEGDALLDALLQIEPEMKGHVDRYGSQPSGEERFAITTYKFYGEPDELKPIVDCADKETDPAKYYACFNAKQGDEEGGPEHGKPGEAGKPQDAKPQTSEPAKQ
jgi:hypothetical protein